MNSLHHVTTQENHAPQISIIVPVYNSEHYIVPCIESILNQTFTDLELILVNDGSTDRSGAICDEYNKKDNRVIVLHQDNKGQASARNLGLDTAKGNYVGFVDSDDYIDINMYSVLYENISKFKTDIAVCGRYNINEISLVKTPVFTSPNVSVWDNYETIKRFLTWDCMDGSPCDKLITYKLIGKLRFPEGYICEDIPFIYKVLKRASKVVHVGQPLYYYLQRSKSTSHSNVFDEKTKGLSIYTNMIWNDVKKEYNSLFREADYFYFSRLLYILYNFNKDENNKAYFESIEDEMRSNLNTIVKNKWFSKREITMCVLVKLNIYQCAKKTKSVIKTIIRKK